MYIKAIVDRLKIGSIKHVIPVGQYNPAVNPGGMIKPYIVVFESSRRSRYSRYDNGETEIIVLTAYPPEHQLELDRYVYFELMSLLDKKLIRVRNLGNKSTVQVSVTDRVSNVITGTSDGYIARERVVTIPYKWR